MAKKNLGRVKDQVQGFTIRIMLGDGKKVGPTGKYGAYAGKIFLFEGDTVDEIKQKLLSPDFKYDHKTYKKKKK